MEVEKVLVLSKGLQLARKGNVWKRRMEYERLDP